MKEELSGAGESLERTRFQKVFEIAQVAFEETAFRRDLDALVHAAQSGDRELVIGRLAAMELGYQSPPMPSASPAHPLVSPPAEVVLAACAD